SRVGAAAAGLTLFAGCGGGGGGSSTPPSTITQPKSIYVTNNTSSAITIYPLASTGNAAPSGVISGAATELNRPDGIAIDSSGNLYVVNDATTPAVLVFSAASVAGVLAGGSGNIAPVRVIEGAATTLSTPEGIAVSSTSIYVANFGAGDVCVFPLSANGNVPPTATITTGSSMLPTAVAVDASNWAANSVTTAALYNFAVPPTSGEAPTDTISGSAPLTDPQGIAFDSTGRYAVANYQSPPGVLIFAGSANGAALPVVDLTGATTQLANPLAIAFDASQNIYVADQNGGGGGNAGILVFAAGATGDVAPKAVISGSLTQLNAPQGIALY
ncbi:MAG TPA: hypothetical protein VME66_07570, partial [Candidatus Acidoferrales bacterium]|nr:hypothetical protein [Candidatus Acidoferrales bacterium]